MKTTRVRRRSELIHSRYLQAAHQRERDADDRQVFRRQHPNRLHAGGAVKAGRHDFKAGLGGQYAFEAAYDEGVTVANDYPDARCHLQTPKVPGACPKR
jgi:hypothetical protein